ncbi:MAG: hypothetical protein QFX33_02690 [Candidatus Nezhaarchaeota archaeon]|nr:hypothetical protein [Candidatus Nezhaarchaeota archaeon]
MNPIISSKLVVFPKEATAASTCFLREASLVNCDVISSGSEHT